MTDWHLSLFYKLRLFNKNCAENIYIYGRTFSLLYLETFLCIEEMNNKIFQCIFKNSCGYFYTIRSEALSKVSIILCDDSVFDTIGWGLIVRTQQQY